MLKILFIRPKIEGTHLMDWYPTLGIGYLSSYVKRHMPVITRLADENVNENYREILEEFRPDIAAISSTTLEFSRASHIAQDLRENLRIPVVIGGPHMMALPESLPKFCDVGAFGEGEQTFFELMQLNHEEGCFPPERLKEIPGIVFRQDGSLVRNPPRTNFVDMDEIPFPDRDLFSPTYFTPRTHFPDGNGIGTSMMTERGCAFRCIYCESGNFWGKPRYHSANYVVAEIKHLLNKYEGLRYINIFDDLFNFSKERVRELAEAIEREGLNKRVAFACQSAAMLINEHVLESYRKMNMRYIGYGLETGSDRIMKQIKYRSASLEKNIQALQLCREYGIAIGSGFMMGNPTEDETDLKATYDFVLKYPLNSANVYITTPLPGTPIWHDALKKGLVSMDMEWTKINQFYMGEDFINLSNVSAERFFWWKKKIAAACAFTKLRANAHSKIQLFVNLLKFVKWYPLEIPTLLRGLFHILQEGFHEKSVPQ